MPELIPPGPDGGRPEIVLTPDEIAQVEALAAVLNAEQIADYFGIGRTTFYEIMKRQPDVAERYKAGKSKAVASIASGLLTQARKGNIAAMIFYLKTQAGWRETTHVDHSSSDGSMTPPKRIEIVPYTGEEDGKDDGGSGPAAPAA